MPKIVRHSLKAKDIAKLGPGRHMDGGGLMLNVNASGARSWLLRVTIESKRREMGLGSARDVSLADARSKAQRIHEKKAAGQNPFDERRRNVKMPTFAEYAEEVWHRVGETLSNAKHRKQWISTLRAYIFPTIGDVAIRDVTANQIASALQPVWNEKAETAGRVLQRTHTVMKQARAAGFFEGINPAEDAKQILGNQIKTVRPQQAMPWSDIPQFYADLIDRPAISALALRLLILTALRSGEVRGALWNEFDRDALLWIIPKERMKAKRDHRVPLVPAVIEILDTLATGTQWPSAGLVFTAQRGKPMLDGAFPRLIDRLGISGITTHGFRSTFSDWRAEQTNYPRELAEYALAHVVGNAVERAYQRSDLLDARRPLMEDWAKYVASR